jgi:DNA-binding transcriptional ArsR family regulator
MGSSNVTAWARITAERSGAVGASAGAHSLATASPATGEDDWFAAACNALADPLRARAVQLLAQNEMRAGEIAARFTVSRPAVSRHLAVLLKSDLVSVRSEAGRRVYSLNLGGLEAVSKWIDQCRGTQDA